jgi:PTS system galactitol-specific IIA component
MENIEDSTANFTIDEKLILVKESFNSRQEVITRLGKLLFDNGFVKDSYTQAVLDREVTYPTVYPLELRRRSSSHRYHSFLKPALAIATLAKPVVFYMMGSPDVEVNVEIIIMLAVHDAKLVIPFFAR